MYRKCSFLVALKALQVFKGICCFGALLVHTAEIECLFPFAATTVYQGFSYSRETV